ncbi:MAG: tRNA (adenosine(37)-N6)-threonylcarbamoyltransferase complex dimerization subunit type 1 TsaB, partial [Bdellovibrionales bacterium]|nr:tRNA (adenosine(37)-N6)-threonylcarbamoyltransferase complex dimerization subunit type 1 TsaB [Bdellovibrionales bacterium]
MKKALLLETSSALGGLALVKYKMPLGAAENLTFREWRRENSHSEVVTPYTRQALEKAQWKISDIDCFAVGVGPGSFTGIRVALNMIRTFAYSADKPVFCFNSLRALALSTSHQDLPILALTNA